MARAQSPIRLLLAHATAEVHPGHISAARFKEALDKFSVTSILAFALTVEEVPTIFASSFLGI